MQPSPLHRIEAAHGCTKGGGGVKVHGQIVFLGILLAALFAAQTASATASWQRQPSPSPSGAATLFSVGCTSGADCFAVGAAGPVDSNKETAFIEGWNGAHWTLENIPASTGNSTLSAVTCASASYCVAIGTKGNGDLVDRWDGHSWANETDTAPGAMVSIACVLATSCVAVGSTAANEPAIQHWDGHTWSAQHAPHADGFGNLYSVACVTASDCTAVGQSYGASDGAQLALHWNGSAWSIRNTAAVPDGRLSNLKGVSCITSSNCWTVGYSETDGDPTGPEFAASPSTGTARAGRTPSRRLREARPSSARFVFARPVHRRGHARPGHHPADLRRSLERHPMDLSASYHAVTDGPQRVRRRLCVSHDVYRGRAIRVQDAGRTNRLNPPRVHASRALQARGTWLQGSALSTRGSPGRPSTRSPRMFFMISLVPPSMEFARVRRNMCRDAPGVPSSCTWVGRRNV